MTSLGARRYWPGVLLLFVTACSSADSPSAGHNTGTSSVITFDSADLTLLPGAMVDIPIHSTANVSAITVGLVGDYGDASLSVSQINPSQGESVTRLRAPHTPANFYVVASADHTTAARLYVAVSASGFASVRVLPTYGGKRAAGAVVASAFLKYTCNDLAAVPPKDGAPIVSSGMLTTVTGTAITLDKVPAGSRVAISARIGHYASGCADIDSLAAGSTQDASLTIYDRPLNLAATDVDTTFHFTPTNAELAEWTSSIQAADDEALEVFSPKAVAESSRLLDAMAAASQNKQDFTAKRQSADWDQTVASWITAHGSLRTLAKQYLDAGAELTQNDISAHITAALMAERADVSISFIGSMRAENAGLSAPLAFSWIGDADDVIHLQGSVVILPTKLATASADIAASSQVQGATDTPSAIARALEWTSLGTTLAAGGYSFDSCDAACTATLCQNAIASMWSEAASTSYYMSQQMTLGISAAVKTVVGDNAEPHTFTGGWLGQVAAPTSNFTTRGTTLGNETANPK